MSGKNTIVFLAVILVIAVLANKNSSQVSVKTIEAAKPALETIDNITRKVKPSLKFQKAHTSEIRKLNTKIKILEASLAGMKELSAENQRLKDLVGFKERRSSDSLPARVMGRDPSNWTNIIYIDKGEKDGLSADLGIVTPYGVVGKIIESGESMSKVMLINDPDSRIAATIQRSREAGLVCGTMSKRCRMIYISPDADVRIGDLVVTSEQGKTFSKGFLIGRITDIFEDRGGLYQSAIIKPTADLQKLEEVLCLK